MGKVWSGSREFTGSCVGFVGSNGKVWSGSSERSGSCVGFASSPNKRGGGALLLLIR